MRGAYSGLEFAIQNLITSRSVFIFSSFKGLKISILSFGLTTASLLLAAVIIWQQIRTMQKLQYEKQLAQFWQKVMPQKDAECS